MVDGVTAVSNRPQSFPLSLSHSSAVSFNLDKNKEHQPSTQPCPKVPPVSPPSVIGLSSRLASLGKGVILTLFQRHCSTKCVGPSQEKVCDVFLFCFFLPSTPSAVNKRDSTASLLLWLSPTWVDCHVSGRGDKLQSPKTAYLNAHVTSSVVLST